MCRTETQRIICVCPDDVLHHSFFNQTGQDVYCARCIESMHTKCAWCKRLIYPGDAITLYAQPHNAAPEMPYGIVEYGENPARFVGCQRELCVRQEQSPPAFWIVPGKVHCLQPQSSKT